MSQRDVLVFVDVVDAFRPRATWVLQTLCEAAGLRATITVERDRAAGCALAYAPAPVADVPTIPANAAAIALLLDQRPLPAGSFLRFDTPEGGLSGAFAIEATNEAFAAPCDLVASAFVLLAAWDELTCLERDTHGRLPFGASVFATNHQLSLSEPAVDTYVAFVRRLIAERLATLGRQMPAVPLLNGGSFAVALTHDVDVAWQWTARGVRNGARRMARAAVSRNPRALRFEAGALARAAFVHLPLHTDPSWTFPKLVADEATRGVGSTYFLLGGHSHHTDGADPATYERLRSRLTQLLRQADREVGLHGNLADRDDPVTLAADRTRLANAGAAVNGVRYHYLRCSYHGTLPMLAEAGFAYDSSLAFPDREGFRCGCSFPFRPYCIAQEQPLDLVELPLAVMDTSLQEQRYRGLSADQAFAATVASLQHAKSSGGAVALLCHPNRFDRYYGRGYAATYWRTIDWVQQAGGACGAAGDVVAWWKSRLDASVSSADGTQR